MLVYVILAMYNLVSRCIKSITRGKTKIPQDLKALMYNLVSSLNVHLFNNPPYKRETCDT